MLNKVLMHHKELRPAALAPTCPLHKTAKWLFTLLTRQAGIGYASPFFPDQINGLLHWVKIFVT